ncbi:MAG: tRNA lysidine(34) synthetase TilS, partial [Gammaproteobacteria bacterium]
DDQLETGLYRWLRGAGIAGMIGMRAEAQHSGVTLWRPLLSVSREQLEAVARGRQLEWVNDPTNQDISLDRNFLRPRVVPLLMQRWPAALKKVQRTSAHLGMSDAVIAELADRILDEHSAHDPGCTGQTAYQSTPSRCLPIAMLDGLSRRAKVVLLQRWLARHKVMGLSESHYDAVLDDVIGAADGAQPLFRRAQWAIRRHNGFLWLICDDECIDECAGVHDSGPLRWAFLETAELFWQGGTLLCRAPHAVHHALLRLAQVERAAKREEIGEACEESKARGESTSTEGGESTESESMAVMVCCRAQLPEALVLPRQLKQRFQEAGVPAWLRPMWPLLMWRDRVVCVPGVWWWKPVRSMLLDVMRENLEEKRRKGIESLESTESVFQWTRPGQLDKP